MIISEMETYNVEMKMSANGKNIRPENLLSVRKNTLILQRQAKSNKKKSEFLGIGMLAMNSIKNMISSQNNTKVETKTNWITGDITKFDFDEELVNEDESSKRLYRIFVTIAFLLLISATILTVQYSLLRLVRLHCKYLQKLVIACSMGLSETPL